MAVSKEVKVGLMALIAGTILYVGFNFLKGIDFLSPTTTYYVVYDNIDGLTVSNPVLLNGFSVGRVHKIDILQNRGNKLRITLEIDNDISLTDSARAVLANNGLLDGKAIVLDLRPKGNPLKENDTLVADREKGFKDLLSAKAGPVLNSIDTTIHNLNNALRQVQAEQRIEAIMANLEKTTASMKLLMQENGKVHNILGNVERLSVSIAETEKSLKPLLAKMNTIADSVSQAEIASTVANANKSLEQMKAIMTDLQEGQGTLGKMLKSDSVYNNMNKTIRDLDALFLDIQARPRRYVHFSVFGKKEKEQKNK